MILQQEDYASGKRIEVKKMYSISYYRQYPQNSFSHLIRISDLTNDVLITLLMWRIAKCFVLRKIAIVECIVKGLICKLDHE